MQYQSIYAYWPMKALSATEDNSNSETNYLGATSQYIYAYCPIKALSAREDYRNNNYLGAISEPCCIREPMVNQKALLSVMQFSSSSGSWMQGWGLSHSSGAILKIDRWINNLYCGFISRTYLALNSIQYLLQQTANSHLRVQDNFKWQVLWKNPHNVKHVLHFDIRMV